MKRPLWEKKKCSKHEAVALLARGRQCSHSTHIYILHSIHFASNSLQLLSCKMIASHRSREQLVILLLMWALWKGKEVATLADKRPEHNNTIKERSEKAEECEEWESKKKTFRGWTKVVSHLKVKHAWKYHKVMFMSFFRASWPHGERGSDCTRSVRRPNLFTTQACKTKYFKPHLHLPFMIPMKTENEWLLC